MSQLIAATLASGKLPAVLSPVVPALYHIGIGVLAAERKGKGKEDAVAPCFALYTVQNPPEPFHPVNVY